MEINDKTDPVQINNSPDDLTSRRNKLGERQRRVQAGYYMLLSMAIVLPIIGALLGWHFYKSRGNNIIWLVPIIYSIIPIMMVPTTRIRMLQLERDIQELDFEIDLQKFEVSNQEIRAEKILRLNDFQLRRYYDLNLRQNSWIFGLGFFCIILGIGIIGVTLFIVIKINQSFETKLITAVLGSIGSILSNFVAAIYLKMNTAATENLAAFHSRLVQTQQLLLGNLLASRIENDEKRWETLSQLAIRLTHGEKEKT